MARRAAMKAACTVEAALIWIPIHLAWLWAGVSLHKLNLAPHTQRVINVFMALAMLGVVALALWSVARRAP